MEASLSMRDDTSPGYLGLADAAQSEGVWHGEKAAAREAENKAIAMINDPQDYLRPSLESHEPHVLPGSMNRAEQRLTLVDGIVLCWLSASAQPPLKLFLRAADEFRNIYMLH